MRLRLFIAILPFFASCGDDGDVYRRNYVISKTHEVLPENEPIEDAPLDMVTD